MKNLAKSRGGSSCVLSSSGRVTDFPLQREPAGTQAGEALAVSA
jgi:hypothetical protein